MQRLGLSRFLFRCYPVHRNIHSTTILVSRRTVHIWGWFHGLMSLVYKQTGQASAILPISYPDPLLSYAHAICTKQWRIGPYCAISKVRRRRRRRQKKKEYEICVCVCVFYFCSVRQRTESTKIKTTHEFTFFNYLDFRKQEKSTFHLITFQSRWRLRLWMHWIS